MTTITIYECAPSWIKEGRRASFTVHSNDYPILKTRAMIGKLNEQQINNLLTSQAVGRLACTDGKLPYIVPVTYVFDGIYIYGQTREGMKLDILRNNPEVCFQVDVMTDMQHWQSVQVRGVFVELQGAEAEEKQHYLLNHLLPIMTDSAVHAHEHATTSEIVVESRIKPVVYKIRVREKTGRFENLSAAVF